MRSRLVLTAFLCLAASALQASSQPAPTLLAFDDLPPGTVVGSLYATQGIIFSNAVVRASQDSVSAPNVLSTIASGPIQISFPEGAQYISIQIDRDGYANRQPQIRAFGAAGNLIGTKLFGQGPDVQYFQSAGEFIFTVQVGTCSTYGDSTCPTLGFSDSYDNVSFIAAPSAVPLRPLDFDAFSLSPSTCADASSYLASAGITFVPVTPAAVGLACNYTDIGVQPSSGANAYFGSPQASNSDVSYDWVFAVPLRHLTFTRTDVASIRSLPRWDATAYDSAGNVLGSVGEPRQLPASPARAFTLKGPGIARVRFNAYNSTAASIFHPPIDDVVLAPHGSAPTWTRLTPAALIAPPRSTAASFYSPGSNRLVVFGGYPQVSVYRNDLWILSGANGVGASTWSQAIANGVAGSPPARGGATLSYDRATNRAILVGGESLPPQLSVLSDVWVLLNADGTTGTPTWTQLSPQGGFPGRTNHLAEYDPTTNRLIVTMGYHPGGNCRGACIYDPAETWVLENANGLGGTPVWTKLATASNPPGRASWQSGSMFDPATNRLFIFGGYRPNEQQNLADVWVLTGANGTTGTATWKPIFVSGPSPRFGSSQFYNSSTNTIGVFGGEDGRNGTLFSDSWVLENADGTGGTPRWIPLTTGGQTPIGRSSASTGYDAANDRLIVSGGRAGSLPDAQTWVLEGATTGTGPRSPILTVNSASYVFDGGPRMATATAVGQDGSPVAGSFTFDYTPGGAAAPVDAGTYSVLATFTSADPGYANGTATGQIVIDPATPSVRVSGGPFIYDAQPHPAVVSVTGVGGAPVSGAATVTYSPGGAALPVNVGSYSVSVTFASTDPNYTDETATGAVVVNKAVPTVQVSGGAFVYDGLPHAATATATGATGAVPGSFIITYVPGGTNAPILIGNYAVAAAFSSTDANYASTTASGAISIAPTSPFATLTVSTAQPAYRRGQPVVVSGQASSVDGTGIANVAVDLIVDGNSVRKSVKVFTDAQGVFRYTFQPPAAAGGLFSASAALAIGGVSRSSSATFRLVGLSASGALDKADLVMGTDLALPITIRNVGDQALSNVAFSVDLLPSGLVTAQAPATIASLPAGDSATTAVIVTAPQGTPPPGPVGATVRVAWTDEASGLTSVETSSTTLTLRPATRVPVIRPASLAVGVNPGRAINRRFLIENAGYVPMPGAYVVLRDPVATPWVSLGNNTLGDLGPGQTRELAVKIAPPPNTPLGPYTVPIDVYGGDSPVAATLQVDVTTSTLGEAEFVVSNDLGSKVAGATVTLYGAGNGKVFQGITDNAGHVNLSGVDAGTYTYYAAAPSNTPESGTVAVTANATTPVSVLLSYDVVTLSFTVTPTTIVDQYNVTLNVTYSTTLPKPAIQVVPYALQLRFFPDDVPNGLYACRLSLTNSHPTAPVRNLTVDASQIDVARPQGERMRITFADGSTVFNAGDLAGKASTDVPCFASLDGGGVLSHGAGNILVSANYDFSLDGQLLVGTTTTRVPVSYLRPDDLSFAAIHYTYDKRTDPANPVLRYEDGPFLRTVRSNRALTIDFLKPAASPFNGRNIVAFTDTLGGSSSLDVINNNAARAFWRADLNPAKQSLTGVGDLTTFDISTLDPPGPGGVSLEDALRAQLAIDEAQLTNRPTYLGMTGQWSDAANPGAFLVPVQITTVLPDAIVVPQPPRDPIAGCLNPEDQYCEDPSGEFVPPPVAKDGQIQLVIEQKVRLERQAFNAVLGIGASAALTNVTASVVITDTSGADASAQFFNIVASDPAGATRGGSVSGQASVAWQLIPTAAAGGSLPAGVQYDVQVLFAYSVQGSARTALTQKVRITVLPSPKLTLHYTLPYIVVPGKQAKIRVRVENIGAGPAKNLSIESAQPRIVDTIPAGGIDPLDETIGPLVNFLITGSASTFDGSTFEAGQLTVGFGDVAAGAIRDGFWALDVSRRGYFIDLSSTMTHQDYKGVRLDALVLPPTTALVPAVGGTITGGAANVPLAALTVSLVSSGTTAGSDTTDGNGAYFISDIAAGPYDLEIRDLAGVLLLTKPIVVLDLQATDFIDISLPTYDPTLAVVVVTSSVPGAQFTADGLTYTTPHSFVWAIGSTHTLTVALTVAAVGSQVVTSAATTGYQFIGWDNAETSPTRVVVVGPAGVTLSADYLTDAEFRLYNRKPITTAARDHRWPSANGRGELVWSELENGFWQVFRWPGTCAQPTPDGACRVTSDSHNHERPAIADDGTVAWFQDTTGGGTGYAVMSLAPGAQVPSLIEFSSRSRPECDPSTGTCFVPQERVAGKTFGMDRSGRLVSYFTFYKNAAPEYRRFRISGIGNLPSSPAPANLFGYEAPDLNTEDRLVYADGFGTGRTTVNRQIRFGDVSMPLSARPIDIGQSPRLSEGTSPELVYINSGNSPTTDPAASSWVRHWLDDQQPPRRVAKGTWADIVGTTDSARIYYECRVNDTSQVCLATPRPPIIDADGDGVPDDLDKCPGTPVGEPVDADGCGASQRDGDGDGITDDIDECPNTPAGQPVDVNGCRPLTVELVDPVPLTPLDVSLLAGSAISTDTTLLAREGRLVSGIASDGVATVVVRITAGIAGQRITVALPGTTWDPNLEGVLFDPLSPGKAGQTVTVTAVDDASVGPVAFAAYRAPMDFTADNASVATTRLLSVMASSRAVPQANASTPLTVVRPKTLFIHGVWGSKDDWKPMFPWFAGLRAYLERFAGYLVFDKAAHVNSGVPFTTGLIRSKASNLGLSYNAERLLPDISAHIASYRQGSNAAGQPIASVQVDVVAHSMGGDITRAMPHVVGYFADNNFSAGLIHKLITVNTPHLGSVLATELLLPANQCVREKFNLSGSLVLETVTIGQRTYGGAAGDLRGPGPSGGALSPALTILQTRPATAPSGWAGIQTAYLATSAGVTQAAGVGRSGVGRAIRVLCSSAPLAKALTPGGWQNLLGESDGIVSVHSQLNTLGAVPACGAGIPCAVHSQGTADLGFGPPSVFELGIVASRVVELLNSAVATFAPLP